MSIYIMENVSVTIIVINARNRQRLFVLISLFPSLAFRFPLVQSSRGRRLRYSFQCQSLRRKQSSSQIPQVGIADQNANAVACRGVKPALGVSSGSGAARSRVRICVCCSAEPRPHRQLVRSILDQLSNRGLVLFYLYSASDLRFPVSRSAQSGSKSQIRLGPGRL